MASMIAVNGYDLLGEQGKDGIRFTWAYSGKKQLLESAAFPQHRKGIFDDICGYTTSVSMGCILKTMGLACKFCRTGSVLPFTDMLTPFDIAKQNVFMVLADMNCSDHVEYHNSLREFAYMGQGEPGYSYTQTREAIELTNLAMSALGQEVYRHIVATAGVPEMIESYKNDIKSHYFTERVTLHFSLHATERRSDIMPINQKYSYDEVLNSLNEIYSLTGEKPCIGILLFNRFLPKNAQQPYSNSLDTVKKILAKLLPEAFRLSFCEFNVSTDVGESEHFEGTNAQEILDYAKNKGFEAKLFSSFGKEESTACGMLYGKQPSNAISEKWSKLESQADKIICDAQNAIIRRGK